MKTDPIIYLDMDGVCVDFVSAAFEVFDLNPISMLKRWELKHRGEFYIHEIIGVSRTDFLGKINSQKKGFWQDLNEYIWFKDLYNELSTMGNVIFLSTPFDSSDCIEGKRNWLEDRFGSLFRDYIFTSRKHLFAGQSSLLIDDFEQNINDFNKYGGGSILFPQFWNRNYSIKDKKEYTIQKCREWVMHIT